MPRSESLEAFVDMQWDSLDNAGLAWKPSEVGRLEFVWMRPLQAEFWTYSSGPSREFPLGSTAVVQANDNKDNDENDTKNIREYL